MATHRVAWKNDKHAAQWTATLKTYAYPLLGEMSVPGHRYHAHHESDRADMGEKPETANRVRGRI